MDLPHLLSIPKDKLILENIFKARQLPASLLLKSIQENFDIMLMSLFTCINAENSHVQSTQDQWEEKGDGQFQ